jgi:ferric-dicitrate binding protein FerR (iron transport regulator)
VRAAVEAEWRELVTSRQRQRRVTAWTSIAAGLAAVAVGAWLVVSLSGRERSPLATLIVATGAIEVRNGPSADWEPLTQGSTVSTGDEVRTTESSRVALELVSGVELRLDRASRLVFNERDLATLEQGAAYVDSGVAAGPIIGGFALRTSAGTVWHVGTQYEARVSASRLRVGIREGGVRIDTPRGAVSGVAGEQIVVDRGQVTRSDLVAHDASWSWVGAVAPAFEIEGRTFAEFLRWVARETGREVVYASSDAAGEASRIVLRGSIEGLPPDESIAAVGSTTELAVTVDGGRIEVATAPR